MNRHDIYKWHADQERKRRRAVSFHAPQQPQDPAFEHIHEPGGFRRNYMKLRANEQGVDEPPMLDNFIDFLTLFGHFVRSLFFLLANALIPPRLVKTLKRMTKRRRTKKRMLTPCLKNPSHQDANYRQNAPH